jgi:hypothetical protein
MMSEPTVRVSAPIVTVSAPTVTVSARGRFGKRVLVGVKSSSEMQEVALRKQELLRRLRKVRGFENVVDVRFSVDG